MSVSNPTLANAAWPVEGQSALIRNVILAFAGSMLIAVCAKISVPMWPVPMTMQTFAVLLIGLAYGARLGFATVCLYLAEGAVGLPVFSAGGHLLGPTGGFLFGFALAAFAAGFIAERAGSRPVVMVFLAAVIATAIIYAVGLPWLANFFVSAKGMSLGTAASSAIANGLAPFIVADMVKAALAAAVLPMAWKVIDTFRR